MVDFTIAGEDLAEPTGRTDGEGAGQRPGWTGGRTARRPGGRAAGRAGRPGLKSFLIIPKHGCLEIQCLKRIQDQCFGNGSADPQLRLCILCGPPSRGYEMSMFSFFHRFIFE